MNQLNKGTLICVASVLLALVSFFLKEVYSDITKTQKEILMQQVELKTKIIYLTESINKSMAKQETIMIQVTDLERRVSHLENYHGKN